MRILFVATSTELGGAEKTVYTLATSLNPERFQVAGVVSLKPPGPYAERLSRQSVPVDTLGLRGLPRPRHLHELLRLIDRSKPDVVHAVMYQAIQLCRLAKGRSAASFKLVSSPRVSYRTRSWLSLAVDRALKGRDDLLVSECEASRRHLIERLGYEPAKVLRIYNGVETPGAAAPPQRQRKRLELGLSQTDILV
ncbi:MAG: glycosyltransferase, partial [Elusimicrobia bacterium]|nr:glycosyltransferase [Elusimicrobiota bacterium]